MLKPVISRILDFLSFLIWKGKAPPLADVLGRIHGLQVQMDETMKKLEAVRRKVYRDEEPRLPPGEQPGGGAKPIDIVSLRPGDEVPFNLF